MSTTTTTAPANDDESAAAPRCEPDDAVFCAPTATPSGDDDDGDTTTMTDGRQPNAPTLGVYATESLRARAAILCRGATRWRRDTQLLLAVAMLAAPRFDPAVRAQARDLYGVVHAHISRTVANGGCRRRYYVWQPIAVNSFVDVLAWRDGGYHSESVLAALVDYMQKHHFEVTLTPYVGSAPPPPDGYAMTLSVCW